MARSLGSRLNLLRWCTAAFLGAAACCAAAPSPANRPKRIYHATSLGAQPAPQIDGRLDDDCWATVGSWTGNYTQLSPRHGGVPDHPTELKILFDDRHLYVAIRAHDAPPAARARFAGDRDEFTGDIVGLCFDSHHDKRSGFEFDLTAAGQKIDLRLFNAHWDTTWNAVWEGKVSHDETGWSAEFLIPLSQLRYAAGNPVWGLHAWRWIDRAKQESNWNLLANDDSGFVQSFGELHGMEGLRAVRRIELQPYALASFESHGQRGAGPRAADQTEVRAGLDAKVGLTSALTLDASVRPDFGQIEADPAVMNLSAFETFLEERRPFFIEGKDIFHFNFDDDDVFYTRRIGQSPALRPSAPVTSMPESSTLLGALKVSGRTPQGLSVGVLATVTAAEEASILRDGAPARFTVTPQIRSLVARAQHELRGGDTLIGGIVTHLQRDLDTPELQAALPESAIVAGLDFTHYWADREYLVTATVVGSRVDGSPSAITRLQRSSARYFQRPVNGATRLDPHATELSGHGVLLRGGKASKGNWRWHEQVVYRSPGLEYNDLGYLAVADRWQAETEVSYIEKRPAGALNSYRLTLEQGQEWTTRGESLGSRFELETELQFRNQWRLYSELEYGGRGRDPVALRGGPLLRTPAFGYGELSLSSNDNRPVFGRVFGHILRSDDDLLQEHSASARLSVRPRGNLVLTAQANQRKQTDAARYVPFRDVDNPSAVPAYFVARSEGESRSLSFRAQWIIRPELRLQYYANPFGSTLRHHAYRQVLAPEARSSAERFGPWLTSRGDGGQVPLDPDGDGDAEWWAWDPDWDDARLRSNLVLKWEYRRGSMLYLVWSQRRDDTTLERDRDAGAVLSSLRSIAPDNQVMVKLTYWFSL